LSSFPLEIILIRGLHIQGPVGPDKVMAIFIFGKLLVMLSDVERDIPHFIELLPMCPVRPFDTAIELRGMRRHNKETDFSFLTNLSEMPFTLRSAVDPDGPDREGKLASDIRQETCSGGAHRTTIGVQAVPSYFLLRSISFLLALESRLSSGIRFFSSTQRKPGSPGPGILIISDSCSWGMRCSSV
jgi:hypothetical protein